MDCTHYIRFSIPICQECIQTKKLKKTYGCHHCHNDEEDHKMKRDEVKLMKCLMCNCVQPKSGKCINPDCYAPKHRYYCGKCSLWEHKPNKEIYHCDKCGLCRVGKKEFHKHCDKCNTCWDKKHFENHICIVDQKENECMICLEKTWDSQNNFQMLRCGHSYHSKCLEGWFKEHYTCPTCKKSAYKPHFLWNAINTYVEGTQFVEEEMNNWKTDIYCNDCEKKSETKYHPVYHKCSCCESWNTEIDRVKK